MGDSNESEKSPLLVANETTAAYSEDVIGEFIKYFYICNQWYISLTHTTKLVITFNGF